jgi:hypothetical protein
VEEEEGKHGGTEDTERRAPGQTIREMREIHYRNSQDLYGRSTTETAWIFLCAFASLHLCVYFCSSLRISFEPGRRYRRSLRRCR